jgi:drug/metabolite transporter, DME family
LVSSSRSIEHSASAAHYRAGVVAVLGAAFLWGALGVALTLVLDRYDVPPITVIAIRALGASAVLLPFVLSRPAAGRDLATLRDMRFSTLVLICGVISTALFHIALIYAFREAGVQVATVLLYLSPSLVSLAVWLIFREHIPTVRRLAIAIAFAGVVGVSGVGSGSSASTVGVLAGLLSAVTYASYSVLGQQIMRRIDPLTTVALSLGIATPILWCVKLLVDGAAMPPLWLFLVIAVVIGVGLTLVPLSLYTWGMQRIGASGASSLAMAEPAVAVVLAYAVLGERLGPTQIAGAAAIWVSVVLVGRSARGN